VLNFGNNWADRSYVMGILNVTPDSFSGDGLRQDGIGAAVAQARRFVAEGADILDIGGESTRPNGEPVTGELERERVLPAIRAVRAALPDVIISIDTYRAETARQALAAGADWINDIWGLKKEPEIAAVAAAAGCPVVVMHNGRNRERQNIDDGAGGYYGYWHYDDVVAEVKAELLESVEIALRAGVAAHNIILDPGIGFGKTQAQNLELLRRLAEIAALGFPLLLGTSRKGFIGQVLGGLPAPDRVEGTLATTVLGIVGGANIVRVHDVKENVRVARMADAIRSG
jgi:dihydropteroate synthase